MDKEKRKAYEREWYQKNKEKVLERGRSHWKEYYQKSKERKKKVIQKHQEYVLNYKKDKCCVICGYKEYPEILQFHHKDKKEKDFTIGKKFGKNVKVIKKEIDKCILLCPNCHSWLHFKEKQIS